MAHLRSIVRPCGVRGCTTRASDGLYSFRNELEGEYCKKHAPAALRGHQRAENVDRWQMEHDTADDAT